MILLTVGVLFLCVVSPTFGLYSSGSDVVDLTSSNFDKLVSQSDNIWVVEFYAPWCGHCKALVPEYQKAATALKGIVKVGGVNCDVDKSLAGRFGVQGFPTIKIFVGGNAEEYRGARTAQGIVDEALSAASRKARANLSGKGGGSKSKPPMDGVGKDVTVLTDSNFEDLIYGSEHHWLVEFYAPGCGFCEKLKPEWAEAATSLKGRIKMGALDATTHSMMAQKYGVSGYPTIKWFKPNARGPSDALDYDGGRTAGEIVEWVLSRHFELVQLTDQSVLKKQCENSPLCVVAVLPHLLDCQSECRNKYLDMLKEVAGKFKTMVWGWVWTEAGSQLDLESKLEIGGFGYPALAVISPKKMKFALLRGSFSTQGIGEFLRDVSFGHGRTADIRGGKLPELVKTDKWDGKDFEMKQEEEEEDIDLSDVVLDDIKDEL